MNHNDWLHWYGCFSEKWGDDLVPESFEHPAKVQPGLSRRIYAHAITRGYIKQGDVVLDPFCGVGCFARHALPHGINFFGVELESKHAAVAYRNFRRWNFQGGWFDHWGWANVIQGDSRSLPARRVDAVVSSPPYADTVNASGEGPGGAGRLAEREKIEADLET